jgi:hypothetical protein
MKKNFRSRITYIWLIIMNSLMSIHAQKMPETSDQLYIKFSEAIQTSNLQELEKVMCKATLVKMRNESVSMGMTYPKDFFDGMKMALLDFKNFTYISYKKEGPTINAYYMYGENKSESSILTMGLVEENGKYMIEQFKMRDAKDFILNLHRKDYSFLDQAEFKPSGVIPVVPASVDKIDYVANVDIVAYGYKVTVYINGFFQDEVTNQVRSGIVIGGIKKGENTVDIKIEKIDQNEKDNPAVAIRALINGEEKEVFLIYEELTGNVTKTFNVQ